MSAAPSSDGSHSSRTSAYSIRSVERVVDVLELLAAAEQPVTLNEVAQAADLPRSSAFRYLATLESRGFAVRDPEGIGYLLGPAFPQSVDRRLEDLVAAARPHLEALAAEAGETVNLGVLTGTRVRYLDIVESHRQVRLAAKIGDRDLLHSTALGKAIASRLPEQAVRHILKVEGMPAFTDRTVTDVQAYLALVEQVRADGYAIDDRENEVDGRCVAVPIPLKQLDAAISLSAPSTRLSMDQVPATAQRLRALAADVAAAFAQRTAQT